MPWLPSASEHRVRTAVIKPLYLPVPCLSRTSISVRTDDRMIECITDNLVEGRGHR